MELEIHSLVVICMKRLAGWIAWSQDWLARLPGVKTGWLDCLKASLAGFEIWLDFRCQIARLWLEPILSGLRLARLVDFQRVAY